MGGQPAVNIGDPVPIVSIGPASAVRSINRFELKYLADAEQARAFREDLEPGDLVDLEIVTQEYWWILDQLD